MIAPSLIVMPLTPTATGTHPEDPAPYSAVDTPRLTGALAAGDEEAFRAFHAAYFDRLRRYLMVVTRGDEEAARDALQETFTRVARYARRFENEEKFWSWLTVLARSAAADGGRKRRNYWRLITRYALSWLPVQRAESATAETDEHLHTLLMEELQGLSAEDRALVEGKYLHGSTLRELAAQSNLTERAVESRLARARREMRARLFERLKNEEAS